ncbi:MAG: tRNA pseudouridine(54/55) synthase Pus10 [Candidatus Heimdallarchaeota archaeon]|nr:tRNA pseudouridine(54/55) synthase Pus10 [Candidatus Heimdallarchaeota archaeon]
MTFEIKKRPRYQLQIKSLFIYGRYQKLIRGIPQTKWPCTVCKGKKCDACNFTGQQYPNSVETLVSRHVIDEVKGSGSKFHGAGREDIDALMLGTGRPFVLEIQQPYIRSLDLSQLQAKINQQEMIKVDELQYSTKAMVRYLKSSSPDKVKIYRALIESTEDFTLQDIEQVKDIGQREINLDQRTPIRVAHRRVDKIRKKVVTKIKVLSWQDKLLEVEISAQGGTYIKEFISGDSDRTKPSLASLLSKELVCKELDVTDVAD